jgi:HPr kinase/phosphorylase
MMLDELGAGSTAALQVELLAGSAGLDRRVTNPYPQKTGLALSGFDAAVRGGRVLVFGESEIRYLESLTAEARDATLARLYSHDIPAVLITQGFDPPIALAAVAERIAVPLLRTPNGTPHAMSRLGSVLDNLLAPRTTIHGVLMDILGLGVLVIGESGIGKSECALDLVVRGHRLVADDTVEVRRRGEAVVIGTCPELTRHHMEVRGLGVINIRDLYGVASTRTSKLVELVVQLERWDASREYDRLGLDENVYNLLGLKVPLIRMPVAPGRNLAILVEVAARNHLLRTRGLNAAKELASRLEQRLRDEDSDPDAEADDEDGERP